MDSTQAGQEQEFLLAELEALAEARVSGAQRELFCRFLRHYYETSSLESLKMRSAQELVEVAHAHWSLGRTRRPGEALIQVLPPADAEKVGGGALARITTCTDDMPFLVDSVTLALRDAGSTVDWAVHPVLRVRRNGKGEISALADGPAESWIHVEFEALAGGEAYAQLEENLNRTLADLRTVVDDFESMRERTRKLAEMFATAPKGVDAAEVAEAAALLRWLDEGHFTFLGYAETELRQDKGGKPHFVNRSASALGLSRKGARFSDPEQLIAPSSELDKYAESPRLVVITKAMLKSPVRYPEFMDVISFKLLQPDGTRAGTARLLGLFSSEAYLEKPSSIPIIRRKVEYVLKRARLPETSHAIKSLRLILNGMPRDELFQSSEEELFATCMGIRALRDRHQLKLFMRRDRYGRFYSWLVYVPRDRYSRELRDKLASELVEICNGQSVERSVDFSQRSGSGALARIHYIVRTPPGTRIPLSVQDVEARLLAATRSWRDQLRELILKSPRRESAEIAARYGDAFPLSYSEQAPPLEAAADLQYLTRLNETQPLLPRLLVDGAGKAHGLKLYAMRKPVALADVLPTLENFGLRAIRQEPVEVTPRDGEPQWIQDFEIQALGSSELPPEQQRLAFESAFLKCWSGETENDGLNRLVLGAGLDWRQVCCLRLITKYLIQTGLPFSQAYMEQLLAEHAQIARLLVQLFEARFDPQIADGKRKAEEIKLSQQMDAALDKVASLDGDRVLRAYLSVIAAGLRTNYYLGKSYISLKLDPAKVPELPLPLPMFEIFVYAPEMEGIHLRGGKVARGGLRWSDRKQDFRTEVLGLMKAQQVKNTVIVPVGAKGGFVLKKADPSNREEWLKAGVECYKTFLRGLLDITDNLVGGKVVPPPAVTRHDADDPYLVVAADKGTATFSDIANGISAEYAFWLGDAFASGGSAGYDHKKMGITARGAWESVKRHFRELGTNIQEQEFTVVGVGDMSGDVFGNGMLLSRKIKLIAAFDHRHIFIDPNPDCESSFKERERLFALPRSSWEDYDKSLISAGGGVYARNVKSVKLSDEAKKALGLSKGTLTPPELMNAILKAPVDLLWNGGIGTYVKASTQSHPECGDRANDAIRVNGKQLRCKVIGEGGNLGFTQLGRIEFALNGGRLNTDAIDNAGGVHSSDREVNIKIPLNELMLAGQLTREKRDPLLASMTDDVARFVLHDNYIQSAAVSMFELNAAQRLDEHANLMRTLERDGLLNRQVEFLPDDESMKERRAQGRGLTRPELAVLLAYSKISMKQAMLDSQVPDDPFFERDLLANFPPKLVKGFREALVRHPLRREIIATMLTNAVVNRMGISFAHRMAADHGVQRAEIIKAYAAAHQIYGGDRYWQAIEALDNQVPAKLQYKLFERACGLLKHATGWIVNSRMVQQPIGDIVGRYGEAVAAVEKLLPASLPAAYAEDWQRSVDGMLADGVPEAVARLLANTKVLGSALDLVELAEGAKVPLAEAAAVYFAVGERFRILWLLGAVVGLPVQGKWQALARTNLRDDTYRIQRLLSERILRHKGKSSDERVTAWMAANEPRVKFAIERVQELHAEGSKDFMALAVAARELRKLRTL
jgi:glutamate dehydrogenase